MIKKVDFVQNKLNFEAGLSKKDKKADNETRILPNNIKTRLEQSTQKTMSAFIDYPVKGLKGDVNSNFYEFLTMGIVPYITGSAMFMFVFNALNSRGILGLQDKKAGARFGKKMALGVVFYGLFKTLSKQLVTQPVRSATGVDTDMPYQNKVCNLPKGANENAEIEVQLQQRKIFDSKEFYRKDLLDRSYFDNVAKKLGLGENLEDSISETSPIIQNIVATSNLAKSMTSYAWAAVGVALAIQDSWIDFFESITNRNKLTPKDGNNYFHRMAKRVKIFTENTWNISKSFLHSFKEGTKQLWNGHPADTGFMKHSGKALLSLATAITVFTTANTIIRAKNMAKNLNERTIDNTKESTVI